MRKKRIGRRQAIKTIAAGGAAAAAASLPAPWVRRVSASDTILLGVPSSLSTPYGVADDTDHLNGTILAQEEINAAGGIMGRELELFVPDVDKLSPESCRQTIAACIDKKVHAISNAFLFAPIPAMDESAKYKCPYLQGTPSATPPTPSRPIRRSTATCCRPTRRRSTTGGPTPCGSPRWSESRAGSPRTGRSTSSPNRSATTRPFSGRRGRPSRTTTSSSRK